MGRKKEGRIHI